MLFMCQGQGHLSGRVGGDIQFKRFLSRIRLIELEIGSLDD